jgi:hypothetical protein
MSLVLPVFTSEETRIMKTSISNPTAPEQACISTRLRLRNKTGIAGIIVAALFTPALASACASCGCTLSSDFMSQGLTAKQGFIFDLRFDYLNQDQLRTGTNTISFADASALDSGSYEIEKYTRNQYLTLGVDYIFNRDWSVNLQLPYIKRTHSSLGAGSDGIHPAEEAYASATSNVGDIKIVGRYLGLTSQHNIALSAGLKLPTGSYEQTGSSTDPATPGEVAEIDTGLQPGTGSTDLIAGLSYSDSLNREWDYFGQVIYQAAVAHRSEYRPGNGFNLNLGLQYMDYGNTIPMLQLNIRNVRTDSGDLADTVSTGGTLAYISPGIIARLSNQASVHATVQLPVYQNVTGIQLTPRYIASVGVHIAF